jgi:hypothetical protein
MLAKHDYRLLLYNAIDMDEYNIVHEPLFVKKHFKQ